MLYIKIVDVACTNCIQCSVQVGWAVTSDFGHASKLLHTLYAGLSVNCSKVHLCTKAVDLEIIGFGEAA